MQMRHIELFSILYIIILYRIIRYLYFMQMSFLQFQIPVNLYKLIRFNSRFARLSWVTLVNITRN